MFPITFSDISGNPCCIFETKFKGEDALFLGTSHREMALDVEKAKLVVKVINEWLETFI
jgi:hypothetical protein